MYRCPQLLLITIAGIAAWPSTVLAQLPTNNVNSTVCRMAVQGYVSASREFSERVRAQDGVVMAGGEVSRNAAIVSDCLNAYEAAVQTNTSFCGEAAAYAREVKTQVQTLPAEGTLNPLFISSSGTESTVRTFCTANRQPVVAPSTTTGTTVPPTTAGTTMPTGTAIPDSTRSSSEMEEDDGTTDAMVSDSEDSAFSEEVSSETEDTDSSSALINTAESSDSSDIVETNATADVTTQPDPNPRALW